MKKTAQTILDEKDYKELEVKAEKDGHTVSSILRVLVKKFLKQK